MAALVGLGLFSCMDHQRMQERLVTIPDQAWDRQFEPWIHIGVEDSTLPYHVYFVIRHTQQYKYENLLLRYGYIAPGDSVKYQDVNLPLGKHGLWLGDTLGTVIETRVRLGTAPRTLPEGDNTFVLSHLMPDEPLTGLLQAGIRIEAASAQPRPSGQVVETDTGRMVSPDSSHQGD